MHARWTSTVVVALALLACGPAEPAVADAARLDGGVGVDAGADASCSGPPPSDAPLCSTCTICVPGGCGSSCYGTCDALNGWQREIIDCYDFGPPSLDAGSPCSAPPPTDAPRCSDCVICGSGSSSCGGACYQCDATSGWAQLSIDCVDAGTDGG